MSRAKPTDALADDRLTLAGLLFETASALRDRLGADLAGEIDLSVGDFEILMRLARSPKHQLRMSELADQTRLSRSGLTRAVDRLEADGLVTRGSCPTDRRGSFAHLTPTGLAQVTDVLPEHLDQLQQLLVDPLSEREMAQLARLLEKVRDHVHPGGRPSDPD